MIAVYFSYGFVWRFLELFIMSNMILFVEISLALIEAIITVVV